MRAYLIFLLFLQIVYGDLEAYNLTAFPNEFTEESTTPVSTTELSTTQEYTEDWSTTSNPYDLYPNASTEYVVTKISGGFVRGFVSTLGSHPANVFKGIPMAEPPLGNLRFARLRPRRPWKSVWNATSFSAACLSNTTRTSSPQNHTAEDCIYMNVYGDARCRSGEADCPVLFYVHGGGFAYDSAVMFNVTQIVQKYASDRVVFLIPAYRLGIFGSLNLGSDRLVPRNLGLHDVIYALEWTKREIKAFGGDPDQITVMGNSAGASAVQYLIASPVIPQDLFKQAIISSGVAYFRRDSNLAPSMAILSDVNCLFDKTTNRTYSDYEKLHCLRNTSSRDLIISQRNNEAKGLLFGGPEIDTELLPAENYAELLSKYLKPRPMISMTTIDEMVWFEYGLEVECENGRVPLGYTSEDTQLVCLAHYNKTFNTGHPLITGDIMRSVGLLTSLMNTRKGAPTYRAMFSLANHTQHADDMLFFFGLHFKPVTYTPAEKLMDLYYPKMIKEFLRSGRPDKSWKPSDRSGKDYFLLDFKVVNGSLVSWPHQERGYEDVGGIKFWLRDEALVEKNARAAERKQKQQRQEQHSSRKNKPHRPFWLPVFASALLPTSSIQPAESEDQLLSRIGLDDLNSNQTQSPYPFRPLLGGEGGYWGGQQQASLDKEAVREVWSAFWLSNLSLTVVVLLSIIIIMMLGTRMLYGYKNARGYSYNSGDGIFTEKTHIITKVDGNQRPRYT